MKDVNVKTKHVKPRAEGESGQIVKMEAPIHHSQVQPVTADGAPSRIAKKCVLSALLALSLAVALSLAPHACSQCALLSLSLCSALLCSALLQGG